MKVLKSHMIEDMMVLVVDKMLMLGEEREWRWCYRRRERKRVQLDSIGFWDYKSVKIILLYKEGEKMGNGYGEG